MVALGLLDLALTFHVFEVFLVTHDSTARTVIAKTTTKDAMPKMKAFIVKPRTSSHLSKSGAMDIDLVLIDDEPLDRLDLLATATEEHEEDEGRDRHHRHEHDVLLPD